MITNFADMIVEYDDVIPADKCKEIIDKFEYDHRKSAGITASDTEGKSVETSIKKSTDLWISQWPEWEKEDRLFFESLSPYVKKYLIHIKEKLGDVVQSKGDMVDSGYQQRSSLIILGVVSSCIESLLEESILPLWILVGLKSEIAAI